MSVIREILKYAGPRGIDLKIRENDGELELYLFAGLSESIEARTVEQAAEALLVEIRRLESLASPTKPGAR